VRPGRRLGVDVGSVRVGVAASDRDGLLATPVATLARDAERRADLDEVTRIAREHDAVEIVVGLPRSLSGDEGASAVAAREYAEQLATAAAPTPVRLVDERLSTVSAQHHLRRSGVRERRGRAVVDQVAAVVILQHALDTERSSGRPPGELVVVPSA
jgi:putative holliday junction resolvase